jgi:hypothetical protein
MLRRSSSLLLRPVAWRSFSTDGGGVGETAAAAAAVDEVTKKVASDTVGYKLARRAVRKLDREIEARFGEVPKPDVLEEIRDNAVGAAGKRAAVGAASLPAEVQARMHERYTAIRKGAEDIEKTIGEYDMLQRRNARITGRLEAQESVREQLMDKIRGKVKERFRDTDAVLKDNAVVEEEEGAFDPWVVSKSRTRREGLNALELGEEGPWASLGDVQKLTLDNDVMFNNDDNEDSDFEGGQDELVVTNFSEEDGDAAGGGDEQGGSAGKGDEDDIENVVQSYFKQYYPEFETW